MEIPDELNALLAAMKLTGKEPAWKFSASTDQVTVQLTWTKAKEQEAPSCKPKPALKSKPPSTRRRDAKRYDQWMAKKTAVVPAVPIQQTTITQTEARDSVVGHVLTPTKYKGEPVGVVVNRDIVTSPYNPNKACHRLVFYTSTNDRGKRSRIDFEEGFDIDDPDLLRTPPTHIARKWLLHAGQLGSQTDGMVTRYNVDTCNRPLPVSAPVFEKTVIRRINIAAVDVIWDYAPRKINIVTMGDLRDPNTPGNLYVHNTDKFIGTQYKKTVYREFYDGSFSRQVQRTEKDNHLGILGPIIKAEVGDVIEVVFKNMASFDNSIYLKNLPLDNEMSKHLRNGVKPGDVKIYKWRVPERSGPGRNEPNCVGYTYNSPVYPNRDIATGLIGPLLICKRGVLDVYGNRKDKTNREFALAFVIFNEANSHYFDENVRERAPNRTNLDDSIFKQSNNKFSINGFIFSNIPNLEMVEGDTIAWYTYSFGSFLGAHSNHFHGQTFVKTSALSFRDDVIGVVPGSYETVEMFADNPGTWFVHCHLGLHMSAGMLGTYTILPRNHTGPFKGYKEHV
ncbi:HEPH [Mytilus edulis]|uniref:HEPH n=1 Tax=Mytilus edulis TaxID=6550 RepID=A0A8S3RJ24_MYTED|nr:HEPH [Mytilus edulis]